MTATKFIFLDFHSFLLNFFANANKPKHPALDVYWRNRTELMERSQAVTVEDVANIEGLELAEVIVRD